MNIVFLILIIILPLFMFFLQNKSRIFIKAFDIIAFFSTVIFAIIAVTSIYQILINDTVFTAAIHAIFLNRMFLIVGSYLLLFAIYKLVVQIVYEK